MSQPQPSPDPGESLPALLRGYRRGSGYDELLTERDEIRPAWRQFAEGSTFLEQTLAQRAEQARLLLRENGVNYNVVGAPQGPERPWELDPLPLLFAAPEWHSLSAGLAQRSQLINAVLADVYGPQAPLREGVLPPAVIFENPSFWLPCHGVLPAEQPHLVLHACDLARQPDGTWFVLADRTQGPSGAGYALENRIIIARTSSRDFETLHIERLAGFFATLRESLAALAPTQRDNPRVVLLSPGPRSSRYFEDGYLARYLGYPLVEGSDLTVRGDRVFLKTLAGLIPVHVVLRRILDGDCDPLELAPESNAGSPGLLQAARSGELAVANAVGSGLTEAPVFQAYLPQLCRMFLGEELRLPCQPTWWCGSAEGSRALESRAPELLVRAAYAHRGQPAVDLRTLSVADRARQLDLVRAHPSRFVVQQPLDRSTAPSWLGERLQAGRVVLRTYAVASPEGYRILPGGLCRVSQSLGLGEDSASSGQASKDVWVLSDRPVEALSLLPRSASAVELRRNVNDVPSRVADHVYWLGRHAERAEAQARRLRSCVVRLTSELDPTGWNELGLLIAALGESDASPWTAAGRESLPQAREALAAWMFDEARPGSLAQHLAGFQRAAGQVRDRLSVDGWRIVSQLNPLLLVSWAGRSPRLGDMLLLLNELLNLLAAFSGIGTESMTRGPVWRFLDMGRRMERALQLLELVRRTLLTGDPAPLPLLEAILEVADSAMTYRHRYLASLQLAPVLDLILVDETNPRGVGFQIQALAAHMARLPAERDDPDAPEQLQMLELQRAIRLTDVDALAQTDADGRRAELAELVQQLEEGLRRLSDSITHRYLAHTTSMHQLQTARAAWEAGG